MEEEQVVKLEALVKSQMEAIDILRERVRELEDDLTSFEIATISLGNLVAGMKSKEE